MRTPSSLVATRQSRGFTLEKLWVRSPGTLTRSDHLPLPAREGSDGSLHRHQSRWESLIRLFAANSYTGLDRAQITGADALSP